MEFYEKTFKISAIINLEISFCLKKKRFIPVYWVFFNKASYLKHFALSF
jgi:hypothetical protein